MIDAAQLIDLLQLEPLADEGGYWGQTWLSDHGSGIYFLMQPEDFSAMHRLNSTEIWHYYAGAPAEMLLLNPDGTAQTHILGSDFHAGQRPVSVVEPGVWMGCETKGDWTLVGTTMAPPFSLAGFELGSRETLCDLYPAMIGTINRLTRPCRS